VRYLSDKARHLVCYPYSVEGLHAMAKELGIGRHWFHEGTRAHYDIPKRKLREVAAKTEVVSSKIIVRVCRGETLDPYGFDALRADPKAWAEYRDLSDEWQAGDP
jgi:Protein of unknown function (DUF4031)